MLVRLWRCCVWFLALAAWGPAFAAAGGTPEAPAEGSRDLGLAVSTGTRGEILPCT